MKSIASWETEFNARARTLERALNRKSGNYRVLLSNVGNTDHGQDPHTEIFDTTCGWAWVDTIKDAVALCRFYIEFYDLGNGNWSGGEIQILAHDLASGAQSFEKVSQVCYNGRTESCGS